MSFSGTPLGQGRRLDHHTFLNKPISTNLPPNSPPRIPTSYAYGAPTLESRSPPKPSHSTRDSRADDNIEPSADNPDEPALVRYARLKQRDQARPGHTTGPQIITSPPHPEKWSVKDTSVNIATAFHQAAASTYDMQPSSNNPHNTSWASGSRPNPTVPRSTSVDYEKETQSTISRRLPVQPNRSRTIASRAKPLTKSVSIRHVPDSEGEEDTSAEQHMGENGRGKSPFEQVIDITKRALAPATFYLRQRSQEPQDEPSIANGHSSYDYVEEEREFQASMATQKPPSKRAPNAAHKRGRMSIDNKAYRPSMSDLEDDDEDEFEDDEKKGRRRKAKKHGPGGGPLNTLPVAGYDKRKKKRGNGNKGTQGAGDEEDTGSDEQSVEKVAAEAPATRVSNLPLSRSSVQRLSAPQSIDLPDTSGPTDESQDIEQGLDSIEELEEFDEPLPIISRFSSPSRAFSIGGLLGRLVHWVWRLVAGILHFILQMVAILLYLIGAILGTAFDVVFAKPIRLFTNLRLGSFLQVFRYAFLAFSIYGVWFTLQNTPLPTLPHGWTLSSRPTYHAPDIPAADLASLSARLRDVENALSGLSLDHESVRSRLEKESKTQASVGMRIGALESQVQKESVRAVEAEHLARMTAAQSVQLVKQEVEVLRAKLDDQIQQQPGESIDESVRADLNALKDRVEDGLKEATEAVKNAAKAGAGTSAGAALWDKITSSMSSRSGLTIKSSDGQDVTSLIEHLVDSAVAHRSKDDLARADFAAHSSGAHVIPSLTSPTYEIRPQSVRGQLIGLVTGNGYAIGRPPLTALHHELHNGHCWPFPGAEGQLGVALAAPIHISDVTIDHVAKEVAFDMRSAPREMELWGLVDGKDNVKKIKEWQAEKARRREEAVAAGMEVEAEMEYPKTLPSLAPYIRIANFTYDIRSARHIQTFPISQEIRDLDVDFGLVVLRIKSNWGRDDFTCLYRMRVHGEKIGETPLPYPGPDDGLN